MADTSNNTQLNVDVGATGSYKSILSGAIADFSNFWKSASGGNDAKTTASNFDSLASKMGTSSKALMGVGVAGAVVAAGAVAIGASAVKAASSFQQLTTQLVTGAGESESNLNMVRSGILKISDATGETSTSAAKGMFLIESAGYHGAQGLAVLKTAAEGAAVGGSDLNTTADALTTVMHDYGISAQNSGQAMNFLVSTVASGKMHMDDLTGSMGKVLPTASALHVPLAQVGAAIAALTSAGTPAARATTALNQTMLQLVHPSAAATKAMQDVGLSTQQVGDTLTHQGLQQALSLITDAVGKKFPAGSAQYLQAIATIGGGTKSLTGILGTTGTNMNTFIANMKSIGDATNAAGNKVIGWNLVQKDEKTQMAEAKASIDNAKIALGEGLLPAVTAITKAISDLVRPMAEWIAGHAKLAAAILGAIGIFGTLVATVLLLHKVFGLVSTAMDILKVKAVINAAITAASWVASAAATAAAWVVANAAILGVIGLIVAAVVAAVALIISHWNTIKKWFSDFIGFVTSIFSDAGSWLVDAGKAIIDGLIHGIEGAAGKVFDSIKSIGSKAVSALKGVLKIFSPSQVFADIGTNIGQGLIQGITGTENKVGQATAKLGQASIVGVQAAPNLNTSGLSAPGSISNTTANNTNNSQQVSIQNLTIQAPNGSTFQSIIASLNQDSLNASKGLTVNGGAINVG